MTDQMWDDPTPTYRPNWRDRARWARGAAESDARAQEAPDLLAALQRSLDAHRDRTSDAHAQEVSAQGSGADEAGEGL